ncbi:hypothetical protein DM01DRAFT_1339174 [Hesseltinella vesiculosa]|uniref:Uncharacterized protein n=1 Tax=Hesseltinella vesiculosa TaxID=101127 RepID=A0A1X2G7M0_9FUNG|nr:hypothetical protein DM01DRAFT_1339174 [Hesseltinella vesiculosa]
MVSGTLSPADTPSSDVRSSSPTASEKDHAPQSNQPPSEISSKRSKKKKQPKRKRSEPLYLDIIQRQIDELKQELRQVYEDQARINAVDAIQKKDDEQSNDQTKDHPDAEPSQDQLSIRIHRTSLSDTIAQLQTLKEKLSKEAAPSSSQVTPKTTPEKPDEEIRQRFEDETLTLLHFFYIVRLAQQGFFSLIASSYPNVEPKALVHLCDKLVGGSLFVVKDPLAQVRKNKRSQVLELLHKLHDGAPVPIDTGFSTTFENVRHLITHFLETTAISPIHLYHPEASSTPAQPPTSSVLPLPTTLTPSQPTHSPPSGRSTYLPPTGPSQPPAAQEARKTSEPRARRPAQQKRPSPRKSSSFTTDTKPTANGILSADQTDLPTPPPKSTDQPIPIPTKEPAAVADTKPKPEAKPKTKAETKPFNADKPDSKAELADTKSDKVEQSHATSETKVDTKTVSEGWPAKVTSPTSDQDWADGRWDSPKKDRRDSTAEWGRQKQDSSNDGWGSPKDIDTNDGWGKAEPSSSDNWRSPAKDHTQSEQDSAPSPPGNGWGIPMKDAPSEPVWQGKLPEDMWQPGDDTLDGKVETLNWSNLDDNRSPRQPRSDRFDRFDRGDRDRRGGGRGRGSSRGSRSGGNYGRGDGSRDGSNRDSGRFGSRS